MAAPGEVAVEVGQVFGPVPVWHVVRSPYEILLLDPDADEAEIERAYRRRVKETHPDQGGSAREFQLVRAAYEELTTDDSDRVDIRDIASGSSDGSDDGAVRQSKARVEYLDYDVLTDNGWGIDDPGVFEKAASQELTPGAYGRFVVEPEETLLEAAENRGFVWPYACRGGACANCAVAVCSGELSMPVNHVLPPEMVERDFRLSCVGAPVSDELQVIFNVKHLSGLDELRLPPYPFRNANNHNE